MVQSHRFQSVLFARRERIVLEMEGLVFVVLDMFQVFTHPLALPAPWVIIVPMIRVMFGTHE